LEASVADAGRCKVISHLMEDRVEQTVDGMGRNADRAVVSDAFGTSVAAAAPGGKTSPS
jgi:hypothetical protein